MYNYAIANKNFKVKSANGAEIYAFFKNVLYPIKEIDKVYDRIRFYNGHASSIYDPDFQVVLNQVNGIFSTTYPFISTVLDSEYAICCFTKEEVELFYKLTSEQGCDNFIMDLTTDNPKASNKEKAENIWNRYSENYPVFYGYLGMGGEPTVLIRGLINENSYLKNKIVIPVKSIPLLLEY